MGTPSADYMRAYYKQKPLYRIWTQMRRRCNDPNSPNFSNYGGRGVSVCAAWQESYDQFERDMGSRPSSTHSVERIDVEGNYEPSNCRWATTIEQARNKRTNRMLTVDGVSKPMAVWADIMGVNPRAIQSRLNKGWDERRAVLAPVRHYTKKVPA